MWYGANPFFWKKIRYLLAMNGTLAASTRLYDPGSKTVCYILSPQHRSIPCHSRQISGLIKLFKSTVYRLFLAKISYLISLKN